MVYLSIIKSSPINFALPISTYYTEWWVSVWHLQICVSFVWILFTPSLLFPLTSSNPLSVPLLPKYSFYFHVLKVDFTYQIKIYFSQFYLIPLSLMTSTVIPFPTDDIIQLFIPEYNPAVYGKICFYHVYPLLTNYLNNALS